MQIEMTGGQLDHLAEAAGKGQACDGMVPQVFQHTAGEVAHVDQRVLRQILEALDSRLGGRAGCRADVLKPRGARHVDAAMNGVDP